MSNWLVGDSARISLAVINPVTGAPIDPPLVTFKIKNPSGVIVDYTYPGTVSKSAVGAYYYDVSLTEKGIWKYRCLTDAPYQAASQARSPFHQAIFEGHMKAEDLAQKFELEEWERRQKDAIQPKPTVESAEYCSDPYCGAEIPKRRREAIPGVQFCAECQERVERLQKQIQKRV